MTEGFKKTVNLKDNFREQKKSERPSPKKQSSRSQEIDRLFEEEKSAKPSEVKRFNRPQTKQNNHGPYKGLVFILLFTVAVLSYLAFFGGQPQTEDGQQNFEESWYSIKLQNGETFYGLVGDISADPIVVKNVYYNYDQESGEQANETGNIRLVKRGKETHGPDGSINIIRSQVQYLEPLSEESKVLQAIMANEGN